MHQTAYAPYSLNTRQFIHQTVYTPDSLYTRQFIHQAVWTRMVKISQAQTPMGSI